jgi:predicted transcriptional regulator
LTKYRSRLQIIAEILEIVRDGAKKTHIMYKANLSYKLLCRYLDECLGCGFVKPDKAGYTVAPKGERFLRSFYAYVKRRDRANKELELMNEEKALLEKMYTSPSRGGKV